MFARYTAKSYLTRVGRMGSAVVYICGLGVREREDELGTTRSQVQKKANSEKTPKREDPQKQKIKETIQRQHSHTSHNAQIQVQPKSLKSRIVERTENHKISKCWKFENC